MNNRFADNDRDLNARLDGAVPPHTRTLGDADADPLVRLAQRLAQGPADGFSDAALDRIEERLNAQMDGMPLFQTAATARRRSFGIVRLARYAAAAALALIVVIATVTQAAAAALPGDRLYPVKRVIEAARIAIVAQDAEAALRISLAERRTDEFEALLEQGEVYPRALEEARDEMARALDLLAAGHGEWAAVDVQFRSLVTRNTFLLDQAADRAAPDEQLRLETVEAEMGMLQERSEILGPAVPPTLPATSPTPLPTVRMTASPTRLPSSTVTPTRTPTATVTSTPTLTATPSCPPTPTPSSTVTLLPPVRPAHSTPPNELGGPGDGTGQGPNVNPTSAQGGEYPGGGGEEKPQGGSSNQGGNAPQGQGK